MAEEVFPWLKSLPLAPEYHPTLAEFQDPISYIFKIEEEASRYGICKIVPPVSASPKKTVIANLNTSLSARNPDSSPTFTTRQQQIGFCPRKHHRPVQKPVWQSGEVYTVSQFEVKAKNFEKNYLRKGSNSKKGVTPLEVETLYWKAHVDKPFSVEYANDMPGSAFDRTGGGCGKKQGKKEICDNLTVGETEWNMRGVSRAKGSLLKFMKEEIPGVTSPMVYISMLFSWFAWHVEDHDFHSLNYMHMGAGKTWYGVPRDAAVAFEDVIRVHGYGGEINPIVTFGTLGEKTTIISPEVLLKAGVPCCRLVQNAGEFVVTFPRAYHSGFSHGFNCGEAANIATPGWLRVARDAAIRRASINCAPMVSHSQLLYDLAISLSSCVPTTIKPEPRSSRLKDKLKIEGESLVKNLFLQDMMENNHLLHILAKGSPIVILPEKHMIPFQSNGISKLPLDELKSTNNSDSDDIIITQDRRRFSSFHARNNRDFEPLSGLGFQTHDNDDDRGIIGKYKKTDSCIFSCVTCGILCYSSVAIIRPTEAAANYLMAADCREITDLVADVDIFINEEKASLVGPTSSSGKIPKPNPDGLFDVPIKSTDDCQIVEDYLGITSSPPPQQKPKVNSSLGLLALAYGGDSSDSDDDVIEKDIIDTNDYSHGGDNNDSTILDHEKSDINDQTFEKNKNLKENCSSDLEKIENTGCDEESSRMHIFCLQHAREVEQRLRAVGGVHMLLLCHQDYRSLDTEAKSVAKELGIDQTWTDLEFRESNKKDKEWIQSALDSEEATHGNRDWAVKLGINLFYSASLSRSPLYTKQMPYNLVIYTAFGHSSTSTPVAKQKPSGRQKKIVVAGKWCGKVWMSNQAHPLLIAKDQEEERDESMEVKIKPVKKPEVTKITQMVVSKNSRKRKKIGRVESRRTSVKTKFPKVEPSSPPSFSPSPPPSPPAAAVDDLQVSGGFRRQTRKNLGKKQTPSPSPPPSPAAAAVDELRVSGGYRRQPRKNLGKKQTPSPSLSPSPPSSPAEAVDDLRISGGFRQQPRTNLGKRQTPSRNVPRKHFVMDSDGGETETETGGGPRMRLRKRIVKPPPSKDIIETSKKPLIKKQMGPTKKPKKPPTMELLTKEEDQEDGEFTCDIEGCNMSFDSKQELIVHKKNICPVKGCGKKFFSHKYLVQHRRVHMDDRPLQCPWKGCKMTFKWAWARTEHIRVHTGARPYVCNEDGCGQTFRFVSDFSRHKRKTGHSVKKHVGER